MGLRSWVRGPKDHLKHATERRRLEEPTNNYNHAKINEYNHQNTAAGVDEEIAAGAGMDIDAKTDIYRDICSYNQSCSYRVGSSDSNGCEVRRNRGRPAETSRG